MSIRARLRWWNSELTVEKQVVQSTRHYMGKVISRLQPHLQDVNFGTSPLAEDWDLLVVLDSCRVDALRIVADEYDYLPAGDAIESIRSPASSSRSWIRNALSDEYAAEKRRTGMVAWNPFTHYECEPENWLALDEVWRDTWNDELGCLPPHRLTERAVETDADADPEQLVVWYQQPHTPYRSIEAERMAHDDVDDLDSWSRRKVWDRVKDPHDDLTTDDVWRGYLDNLRWVLDEVEALLEEIDAEKPVLTADHGELIGEWLLYGHADGLPAPELLYVPWAELRQQSNPEP